MHAKVKQTWRTLFMAILPTIHKCVVFAFRHLPDDEQKEMIQEALANACVACARLVAQGRADRAYPTALARFAVARIRDGRMVGSRLNIHDVLSPYAQRKKHLAVERLDRFDTWEGQWLESVVEDHRTPVPDQVWFRLDFPAWLLTLSLRDRQIALALAIGDSTGAVARQFSISAARVSQLRRSFQNSWQKFHGEMEAQPQASAA